MSLAYLFDFAQNTTDNFDWDKFFDMGQRGFTRNSAVIETKDQWRNVVAAVRQFTKVDKDNARGIFDDYILVFWLSKNGKTKNAQVFHANTDPSYQYSEEGHKDYKKKVAGLDADGDGKVELGMLKFGAYKYNAFTSTHKILGNVFKPVVDDSRGIRVWRDINHDGSFTDKDERLVKDENKMYEGGTMYIHRGYREGQKVNTWSAGCQTMKFEDFEIFRKSIAEGNKAGQLRFTYVLTDMIGVS